MKSNSFTRNILHFISTYQIIIFFMVALAGIALGVLSVYSIINDTADPKASTGSTTLSTSFDRGAIESLKQLEAPTNVEPLIQTGQRINPFSNVRSVR